jgi:hypothetical protein
MHLDGGADDGFGQLRSFAEERMHGGTGVFLQEITEATEALKKFILCFLCFLLFKLPLFPPV